MCDLTGKLLIFVLNEDDYSVKNTKEYNVSVLEVTWNLQTAYFYIIAFALVLQMFLSTSEYVLVFCRAEILLYVQVKREIIIQYFH